MYFSLISSLSSALYTFLVVLNRYMLYHEDVSCSDMLICWVHSFVTAGFLVICRYVWEVENQTIKLTRVCACEMKIWFRKIRYLYSDSYIYVTSNFRSYRSFGLACFTLNIKKNNISIASVTLVDDHLPKACCTNSRFKLMRSEIDSNCTSINFLQDS